MSELPTASLGMRTHVANATVSKSVHRLGAKKEGLPQGKSFFFGRSGGTRTHGLQYPKLARYHLRYASIDKKLLNFVVVSYVVKATF